MQEQLKLIFSDGATNVVTVFRAQREDAPVVVILPAMGVPASYYRHYAADLSASGYHVATADNRGHGNSSVRPSRKVNYSYYEHVEIEYLLILQTIRRHFPQSKLVFMGHSLGGQIGAMFVARHHNLVDGLILNASCSIYYKGWKGASFGIWLFAGLCKVLGHLVGYYPGHIVRFGNKEARGVIDDWHYTAVNGVFKAKDSDFNYETAMCQLPIPVLGLTYEGDTSAPPLALKYLTDKFPQQQVVAKHVAATGKKFNHYSWIKQPEISKHIITGWITEKIA